MALVLRVLVAGECSVAEGETRTCNSSSFTIGRGVENDWVVSDPQRHLSKQHCRIELRGQTYYVIDTSTNGVFVAGAATPLGRGNAQPVNDGDVINLGPCSLRLEIEAFVQSQPVPAQPNFAQPPFEAFEEPAEPARPVSQILSGDGVLELPLAAMLAEQRRPETQGGFGEDVSEAGHYASTSAFFQAPEIARPTIPADWHTQEPGTFSVINAANLIEAETITPPPVYESGPTRGLIPPLPSPVAEAPTARPQPIPAPPPPAPLPAPAPSAAPAAIPADLLASFLAGAGLPPDAIEAGDAADMMLKLGQAFREAVGGLRELLELRAFLKSEFRIEHTLLRAKENNPLKFSSNLDGTLSVLLGRRVPGFMAAPEAIRESVRDVKAHEVALIAGLKAVVNDVLEQLSPDEVKSSVGSSMLQQVYKARCWEKYEQIHQRLAGDQNSGPPLGTQFSKAYTNQFKKI
jgi:type VI secretion system FHA domain protein